MALQPIHGRVEREREEKRDQQPAQHVARYPEHIEDDADCDQDAEHREDRSRPEVDDAVGAHGWEFRVWLRLPLQRWSP